MRVLKRTIFGTRVSSYVRVVNVFENCAIARTRLHAYGFDIKEKIMSNKQIRLQREKSVNTIFIPVYGIYILDKYVIWLTRTVKINCEDNTKL